MLLQVHQFNGTPVRNLNHLVEMVVQCKEHYMRFDLDYEEVVVLNADLARKTTADILDEHSIPDMSSEDVMDHLENVGLLKKSNSGRSRS